MRGTGGPARLVEPGAEDGVREAASREDAEEEEESPSKEVHAAGHPRPLRGEDRDCVSGI